MKKPLPMLLLATLLLTPVAIAAEPPPPTVIVETNEAKNLAKGYAHAFKQMRQDNNRQINLVTRRDGKLFSFTDVRAIDADESVLVLTLGRDETKALINARDVFLVTTGDYHIAE